MPLPAEFVVSWHMRHNNCDVWMDEQWMWNADRKSGTDAHCFTYHTTPYVASTNFSCANRLVADSTNNHEIDYTLIRPVKLITTNTQQNDSQENRSSSADKLF